MQLIWFAAFTVDVGSHHRPDDDGVLVAHGDQGGGYALYVLEGGSRRSPTTTGGAT